MSDTPEQETVSAQEAPEFAAAQFVRWFREVAPYVHAFRGKTFVVAFGGELVQANVLNTLVQDLSLLSALGIKLVLVHGSRPQVNEQLRLKGFEQQFDRGRAPMDANALECAKGTALCHRTWFDCFAVAAWVFANRRCI
jgi:amino-acid N-acetyltransferase